jgi:hypothetical protein
MELCIWRQLNSQSAVIRAWIFHDHPMDRIIFRSCIFGSVVWIHPASRIL